MARIKKKGTTGAVVNYISRSQALKKLQIPLKDFRRLCILKGIYPRDPPNKKKLKSGSSATNTWYFRKDIKFMLHEPLLQKFRGWKIYVRKLSRAVGKRNYSSADCIRNNQPTFEIDHIIKERYPSFNDALNDMDDALSMIFLFASMRSTEEIRNDLLERVYKKSIEFIQYVIHTQCLRKTFISIKGIYYQVEIRGQEITWVTPHQFSQEPTMDVDFKVMGTFLELYDTLLGFVLFKLYTDAGLKYPPTLNNDLDKEGGGVAALILQSSQKPDSAVIPKIGPVARQLTASEKRRLQLVKAQLANIKPDDDISTNALPSLDVPSKEENEELVEDFDAESTPEVQGDCCDLNIQPVVTYSMLKQASLAHKTLFSNLVFYISREVPRSSLEFVIKAFGGKVGWDAVAGAGSAFMEDDFSISHHVVDRPMTPEVMKKYPMRTLVQPQWVFDCVNAGKLLLVTGANPGEGYAPGLILPPHLSPFEVTKGESYDPNAIYNDGNTEFALADSDIEDEVDVELEAVCVEDDQETDLSPVQSKNVKARNKMQAQQESDKLAMSKILMSNRNKHLFNKLERTKRQEKAAADTLKRKKSIIEQTATKKVKTIRI